jgi:hypothetical protein
VGKIVLRYSDTIYGLGNVYIMRYRFNLPKDRKWALYNQNVYGKVINMWEYADREEMKPFLSMLF